MIRELSINDGIEVYDLLQRIGPDENAFLIHVNGMTYSDYQKWLIIQHQWSLGENLPEGYVKQWTYWLIVNNKPIGYGKLRERATEQSRLFGGNIGFAIDPLERGKGYGNQLFSELLREAKLKGIKEVFSTAEKYNYPSYKVHLLNGGKLVSEDEKRWYFEFDLSGDRFTDHSGTEDAL